MGRQQEGILRFSFCAKMHVRFFSHDIHNSLRFSLKSQQFALFLSHNNLRFSIKSQWLAAFLSIHNSLQHFYQFTTVCSISLNSQQFAAFLYQLTMVCSEFQQFTTVCAFCAQNIKRVHDPWRLCKPDIQTWWSGSFGFCALIFSKMILGCSLSWKYERWTSKCNVSNKTIKIWKMDIKMQRFKKNEPKCGGWDPDGLQRIWIPSRDTCVTPAWHLRDIPGGLWMTQNSILVKIFHFLILERFRFFVCSLQDKNSKTLQTLSYYLHPEWLQLVFVFWTICQINTVSQAICMLGSSFPFCQTREDQRTTLAWDWNLPKQQMHRHVNNFVPQTAITRQITETESELTQRVASELRSCLSPRPKLLTEIESHICAWATMSKIIWDQLKNTPQVSSMRFQCGEETGWWGVGTLTLDQEGPRRWWCKEWWSSLRNCKRNWICRQSLNKFKQIC